MGKILGLLLFLLGLITGLIAGKMVVIPLASSILVILWAGMFVVTLFVAIYLYSRNKLIRETYACPKCTKPITRVRRTVFDRFLGIFIPNLRRCSCSEPFCRWTGLVVDKEEHFRSRSHAHPRSQESLSK